MLSKVQIKTIHSLQHKKYRQKSGRFIAEGIKVVEELLREPHLQVEKIYALPSWIKEYTTPEVDNVQIEAVTKRELKSISCLTTPQTVLAICHLPQEVNAPELSGKVSLLLESIRDPGNMGTIIRIADWFGISQLLCSSDCVDAFNPKTIQATMGSIARVKIWSGSLAEVLQTNKNVPLLATTLEGRPLTEFSKLTEGIIAVGNESVGLSDSLLQQASEYITIPRTGGAESLNAAVATGIVCSRLLL